MAVAIVRIYARCSCLKCMANVEKDSQEIHWEQEWCLIARALIFYPCASYSSRVSVILCQNIHYYGDRILNVRLVVLKAWMSVFQTMLGLMVGTTTSNQSRHSVDVPSVDRMPRRCAANVMLQYMTNVLKLFHLPWARYTAIVFA